MVLVGDVVVSWTFLAVGGAWVGVIVFVGHLTLSVSFLHLLCDEIKADVVRDQAKLFLWWWYYGSCGWSWLVLLLILVVL